MQYIAYPTVPRLESTVGEDIKKKLNVLTNDVKALCAHTNKPMMTTVYEFWEFYKLICGKIVTVWVENASRPPAAGRQGEPHYIAIIAILIQEKNQ